MLEFILIVRVIAGAWGTAYVSDTPYPTEKACYAALEKVRVTENGKLVQGERGMVTIVQCVPRKRKD